MTPRRNELVFDAWTPLSFKGQLGRRRRPGNAYAAPRWTGEDHQRRLEAYMVLQAYYDNSAREFLRETTEKDRGEHREYGDAAVLRNAALSALLGESQTIAVKGAGEDPNAPGGRVAAGDDDSAGTDPDAAERTAAARQQEWLDEWAEDERLLVKLQENERNAVGLGDGVYVLGWSNSKERPRLRIFDPGFYFPVLHDGNEDDYPERVHIAWEVDNPEDYGAKPTSLVVRRMTWELVPLEDATDGAETERAVPYQTDPVTRTCLFTDAAWIIEGGVRSIDDLTGETARYMTNEDGEEVNRLDLGFDFIPVVHVPNTVSIAQHYGQSVISSVAQILDDLANADTDLSAASATTGTPPITLSGTMATAESLTYRPGTVFRVGDNGRMDVLDTSRSLDALLKYVDQLMDRLSTNGRMPAALLGRVNPSDVPSGVALALSFGPLSAMVREMRLARREKYRLLFKFAHRMAVVGGVAEDTLPREHATTDLDFGPFLPNDEAAAVQLVTNLLNAQAISLEQAVMILRAAGITERDLHAEILAIQSRDFEGANRLFDALGEQGAVYRYLGRNPEGGRRVAPTPPQDGRGGTPPPTPPPPPEVDPDEPAAPPTPPTGV